MGLLSCKLSRQGSFVVHSLTCTFASSFWAECPIIAAFLFTPPVILYVNRIVYCAQAAAKQSNGTNGSKPSVSGRDAFVLYDTYGFPLEITQELASAHGVTVDLEGFTQEMQVQLHLQCCHVCLFLSVCKSAGVPFLCTCVVNFKCAEFLPVNMPLCLLTRSMICLSNNSVCYWYTVISVLSWCVCTYTAAVMVSCSFCMADSASSI